MLRSIGSMVFTPNCREKMEAAIRGERTVVWRLLFCPQRKLRASRSRRPKRSHTGINANGVCFLLSNCSVRFGSQCPTTENDHGKSEIADSCSSLRIKLKRTIPIRAGRPLAKVSDAFHKNFGRPVARLNFEATLQFLFR